jgi:hypothetical protein
MWLTVPRVGIGAVESLPVIASGIPASGAGIGRADQMKDPSSGYNLREICRMLNAVLDDAHLHAFCLERFPPAHDRLAHATGKDDKVVALVNYCRGLEDGIEALLDAVRAEDDRGFRRFEPYLVGDEAPVVSGKVDTTTVEDWVSEIGEWRQVQSQMQELLSALRVPLSYLQMCRSEPTNRLLDEAGASWQELCAPKLESVSRGWRFCYAYSPSLEDLREQAESADQVTRWVMRIQKSDSQGITDLYCWLVRLSGMIWDSLIAADKRIMVLVGMIRQVSN